MPAAPAPTTAEALQAEAVMLARYCASQRREYLHEVACNIRRGPAEADRLCDLVADVLAQRAAAVR